MTTTAPAANYRKKLIEVALPLEAINAAAAKEKSIRHGHPSTLHLWWARRPLAACRAVLFGQFVDDPSSVPEEFPSEETQEAERQRLFRIIEDMVPWANSNDEAIFHRARVEIARSIWRDLNEDTRSSLDPAFTKAFGGEPARSAEQLTGDQVIQFLQTHAPPVLDPFAGGGSIPLEAQRLGLRAIASDLNPVAVLINKALIEIPPKFAGRAPVNPTARKQKNLGTGGWKGAQGLANDVRYYGEWMREQAWNRIGHLYPQVDLPPRHGGGKATVIAWLWARTVKCPNPACGATMPLASSFALSSKKGKESWVKPILSGRTVNFAITDEKKETVDPPKTGRGANFKCIVCNEQAPDKHIKAEGAAGRMGAQLMAIVAEGKGGRIYLAPSARQAETARSASPSWGPDEQINYDPKNIWCPPYGLTKYRDLFTPRQLVALTTFSDLVSEAITRAHHDARAAGLLDDDTPLEAGGTGARAYAEAVGVYLTLSLSKATTFSNTMARWRAGEDKSAPAFGRQALPMVWDYTEVNPFAGAGGDWNGVLDGSARVLEGLPALPGPQVAQADATKLDRRGFVVSTDPPYYDNIGYADLSDFFYVWIRRTAGSLFPTVISTLLVPKEDELVAAAHRFGGSKASARDHFEAGMHAAFVAIAQGQTRSIPAAIYYAFKQAEDSGEDRSSTGWATMLSGLIGAQFEVHGTWPLRTEGKTRMIAAGTNSLSSSILLACRVTDRSNTRITRADFTRELRNHLTKNLGAIQQGSILPVDLAQAAIGPGMSVFSSYHAVLEPDGSPMSVEAALQLINRELDGILRADETDLDEDTRFAVGWYEQHGYSIGAFGDANILAQAKNTSVQGVIDAGILRSSAGKAQLIPIAELPDDWDPTTDERPTVWEATHHLIRQLDANGEEGAARLLAKLGATADAARSLAYRLYSICERKGWTEEARAYNALILSWPDIARLARGEAKRGGIEAWGDDSGEEDEE